jgi:DNA-binding response OmpR family regulator
VAEPSRGLVLIVDDHPDTRDLFVTVLTSAGFKCVGAATAAEALHRARVMRFDVVVMDVGLPTRADGMALARQLRALPDAPPVIAVTGHRLDEESATELFAIQLMKPVDPEEVVSAALRAIDT